MELNSILMIIALIVFIVIIILIYFLSKLNSKNKTLGGKVSNLESRYARIINIDDEIDSRKKELTKTETKFQNQIDDLKESLKLLKEKYQKASEVYDELSHQNNLLKDNLDIAEFGIYEPHFDFETSEIFKEEIKDVRDEQKELVRDKMAVLGGDGWTVNDSVQK